jgi:hypothetical protein
VDDPRLIRDHVHVGDIIRRGSVDFLVMDNRSAGDSFSDNLFIVLTLMNIKTFVKNDVLFVATRTLSEGRITLLSEGA